MTNEKSANRHRFDGALNVLLIEANLDGTRWAIEQIREVASKGIDPLSLELGELANQLEGRLDMRAAHLALED